MKRINAKAPDPARVDSWDFFGSGSFVAPAVSAFAVTVGGQNVAVSSVGFKRRPLSAPLDIRDLRIDNCLYLTLATPIADGQAVEVKNPDGTLWAATEQYVATADPLRFNPAIHVNEEGYVPSFPKKAMIGYYLGNEGGNDRPGLARFQNRRCPQRHDRFPRSAHRARRCRLHLLADALPEGPHGRLQQFQHGR